jgi:hypothetical protein
VGGRPGVLGAWYHKGRAIAVALIINLLTAFWKCKKRALLGKGTRRKLPLAATCAVFPGYEAKGYMLLRQIVWKHSKDSTTTRCVMLPLWTSTFRGPRKGELYLDLNQEGNKVEDARKEMGNPQPSSKDTESNLLLFTRWYLLSLITYVTNRIRPIMKSQISIFATTGVRFGIGCASKSCVHIGDVQDARPII